MRGLRKVQPRKVPKLRPGLDDPKHLAKVRALPCAIRGRRTTVEKWVGVYPHRELVTMEVQHVCDLSSRSQAHHTTRKAQRGADSTAAPLCPSAHDLLHRMGVKAFEAMWQIDLAAVAAELAR